MLDPWNDAAYIAAKLDEASTYLIAVIGAEGWCEKCRDLKPHFEIWAQKVPETTLMLWLDLEEHHEFLGDYIPESLPEVLIYSSTALVSRSLLPDGSEESLLAALQARQLEDGAEDPGIARRLVQQDWE
jgi:thiol-disulfide isomerase/thioredoxin